MPNNRITSQISFGDIVIPLDIRKSDKAKRIAIKIPPAKNMVCLTLPKRASVAAGMKFLNSKAKWIMDHIDLCSAIPLTHGSIIPIFGVEYSIENIPGRGLTRLCEEKRKLFVYCQPEFATRRVKEFLKKHLRSECIERSRNIASTLGKVVTNVSIRETSLRWGSCSHDGVLSFNWLLIFAPLEVLDYLIAHETAHLVEMNHSPRFWKLVAKIFPTMEMARDWLKTEGHRLHRYDALT